MKKIIPIICLILLLAGSAWATDYTISTSTDTVDGATFCGGAPCTGNDRLILAAGTHVGIGFINLHGSAGNPIIITNASTGVANITSASPSGNDGYAGISFNLSDYFELDGSNYSGATYGITIQGMYRGMQLRDCENYEIAWLEISNTTNTVGLRHNANDTWDQTHDIVGVKYHDLYIHDTATEGMYLGHSSADTTVPEFSGIEIYNIITENTGWDGIQLAQVKGTGNKIYNCTVTNAGTAGVSGQDHGIIINPDVWQLDVYGNTINTTHKQGIYNSINNTNVDIHDNVIISAGENGINNVSSASSNTIRDNTVISSGNYGINSGANASVLFNLLVANTTQGCTQNGTDCSALNNNRTSSSVAEKHFVDPASDNYRLTSASPAVDAPSLSGYSTTDADGNTRPASGTTADIGAYEYYPSSTTNPPFIGSSGGIFTVGGVPAIGGN